MPKNALDIDEVSIDTLAGGALVERANDALAQAYSNILDPNTPATEKRKVLIEVTLTPTEMRDFCVTDIKVSTKLAAPTPVQSRMYLGQGPDGPVATEYDPKQMRMQFGALVEPAAEAVTAQ